MDEEVYGYAVLKNGTRLLAMAPTAKEAWQKAAQVIAGPDDPSHSGSTNEMGFSMYDQLVTIPDVATWRAFSERPSRQCMVVHDTLLCSTHDTPVFVCANSEIICGCVTEASRKVANAAALAAVDILNRAGHLAVLDYGKEIWHPDRRNLLFSIHRGGVVGTALRGLFALKVVNNAYCAMMNVLRTSDYPVMRLTALVADA